MPFDYNPPFFAINVMEDGCEHSLRRLFVIDLLWLLILTKFFNTFYTNQCKEVRERRWFSKRRRVHIYSKNKTKKLTTAHFISVDGTMRVCWLIAWLWCIAISCVSSFVGAETEAHFCMPFSIASKPHPMQNWKDQTKRQSEFSPSEAMKIHNKYPS